MPTEENFEVAESDANSDEGAEAPKKRWPTARHFEIMTDADKLQVDIQEVCNGYKTIKNWAYILHDKDDTRPHYHIYVHFGTSAVSLDLVAKWFKVPENFVSKVKGRRVDVLQYLTHSNDTQQHKHQYSPDEVIANFDINSEIEASKIIGDFEKYSYAQQLEYVNSLPISEKSKVFSQLKKLWEIYCQCLTLQADRDIQVVFIDGKAGTGKTTYAKKLCRALNYDFCMSSSSNDPFQDYMGQKAIILDDMRDEAFDFVDLLKILDNHAASSVKSRFNNKVFNGEMIIITSSVPISFWYRQLKYSSSGMDSLTQLYRRISSYVEVLKDYIKVYDEGLDEYGKPKGNPQIFENEIPGVKMQKPGRKSISSVFKNITFQPLISDDEITEINRISK